MSIPAQPEMGVTAELAELEQLGVSPEGIELIGALFGAAASRMAKPLSTPG